MNGRGPYDLKKVAIARDDPRRPPFLGRPSMRSAAAVRRFAAYDPVQRTLHWLMAALIFVALALGFWARELPRGEFRSDVLWFHKPVGMTRFLCFV
jgi:hypothetical protein